MAPCSSSQSCTTANILRKILAAVLFVLALAAGTADAVRTRGFAGDFRAFRCGAAVLLEGGNPYAAQPMYACESSRGAPLVYRASGGVAVPDPLPGYAIVAFVPFAVLPLSLAIALWSGLLLLATAFAVSALGSLGVARARSLAVLACGIALTSIPFGEVVPVVLAATCGCALALARRRPSASVAWAALASLEPHAGAPLMLALIAYRPTRWRALLAAASLALLHAIALRASALAYFTEVLPQHARAELLRSSQYSLSWIAASLGAPEGVALALGAASYAVAALAGVAVAFLLARHMRMPAMLALVPPAFALAGGTFVHLAQVPLALPFGLVLIARARGSARAVAFAGLVALALPWYAFVQTPWFVALVLPASVLIALTLGADAVRASIVGIACTALACTLALVAAHDVHTALAPPPLDPFYAQYAWGRWIAEHDASRSLGVWCAKLPTWAGLAAIAVASFLSLRSRGDRLQA